jgi:glutathione S-transferase
MITLHYSPGACSLAPHIVLEWIGAPYQARLFKYGDPESLKLNPAGAVPVLDTGEGWTLTQAGAILLYLARRFTQADLAGPQDLRGVAEVARWSHFLTGDLHPAFFPIFMTQRYTTATDDASLVAVRDAAKTLVKKRFALLEAHLANRKFLVGDRRSFLDAYLFPMARWGEAKLPGGLTAFPAVRAHATRMNEDAAVQRVLDAEASP